MSRVTVVGSRRRIAIAVPSATPIGEYSARLAAMCGQDQDDNLPPAWSLAIAGEPAMPLDVSLSELGICDGQVLYLRDIAEGPGEPPRVEDMDEVVAEETNRQRRGMLASGPVYLSFGLIWLVGLALLTGFSSHPDAFTVVLLTVGGLTTIGTAWVIQQRKIPVPETLRLLTALTALPMMAASGMQVAQILGGNGYRWAGGVAGVNIAAAMVLAAIPGAVIFAVEIQVLVTAILLLLVFGFNADRTQSAAILLMVGIGMLALARRITSTITAWAHRPVNSRVQSEASATRTVELVRFSGRLLGVVLVGPVIAIALSLPMIALTGRPVPLLLTLVAALALLARARLAGFTAELLAYGALGLEGLFVTGLGGARYLQASPAETASVLMLSGIVVVAIGVAGSLFARPAEADQGIGLTGRPRPKRSRAEIVGVMTAVAVVPLTMAVMGVFSDLLEVGKSLF